MNILLYGLQRSGTNYLEALLKKRYKVNFVNENTYRNSPLQKHFRLYDQKDIIPEPEYRNEIVINNISDLENTLSTRLDYYLILSKDPYSWFLSYSDWAKRCHWLDVKHHYIVEYNLFYGKWLELSEQADNIIFIRYVDLLADPDLVLSTLENRMKLKKKLSSYLSPKTISRVSHSSKFSSERSEYYLERKYLDRYDEYELSALEDNIDKKVVGNLGY